MKNILKIAAATAFIVVPLQANSATGNIQFNGSVANSCIITVGTPGTMAASGDFTVLSSTETGGVAGTASLLTTGAGFELSADAPTSFGTAPATGNTDVTFAASYSSTGANVIGNTAGTTATTLQRGSSDVSINLAASKTAGTFEAGTYAATVVLRCE